VIVGLALPQGFAPEGDLRRLADVDRQRQAIRQARTALAAELAGRKAAVYATYTAIPAVALTADAEALAAVLGSAAVSNLQEDVALRPALDSSTPIIGAPAAWAAGYDGTGQAVVILDTGIDGSHPFFQDDKGNSRIVAEACFSNAAGTKVSLCPNGLQSQTGSGAAEAAIPACLNGASQLCDHGSHVAGIAAGNGASFDGVARNADIIAIQVFTRFNGGGDCSPDPAPCVMSYISNQLSALDYVYTALPPAHAIAAVNLSLGDGHDGRAPRGRRVGGAQAGCASGLGG
jgi:subtilisin family serine protease